MKNGRTKVDYSSFRFDYESPATLAKLNRYRKEMGLYPVSRGTKICLRCNKQFLSANIKQIHMCTNCRRFED